jgi:hypothetical protein
MSDIIRFKRGRPGAGARHQSRHLMERVYTAGSMAVAADDLPTKLAAALLETLGFFVLDEIQPDGTARRLRAGETRPALARGRPWRISKPALGGGATGIPDAAAAFPAGAV